MFNNLKAEENHWISTPRAQTDPEDDPNQNARAGELSPNIPGERNFDPAVGRPVAAHGAASAPVPMTSPVAVTHTSVSNLTNEDIRYCKVCRVDLSGLEPARQHYAGKQHQKNVQKTLITQNAQQGNQEAVALKCEVCMKSFTGEISAKQHFESKGHQKAMEGAAKWASSQRSASSDLPGPEERAALTPDSRPVVGAGGKAYSLFPEGQMAIGGVAGRTSFEDEAKVTHRARSPATVSPADSTGGSFPTHDRATLLQGSSCGGGAAAGTVPGRSSEGGVGGPRPPPGLTITTEGTKGNAMDVLRDRIISLSTAVLEEKMKLIIPQAANQIADAVIGELTGEGPAKLLISDSGFFTAASSPASGRGAENAVPAVNRDNSFELPSDVHVSVPASTISSAGSLQSRELENDLSNVITGISYNKDWDALVKKNRDGSP